MTFLGINTVGIGASIIYANYDSEFKFRTDKLIPGFADVADKAGRNWRKVISYITGQPMENDNSRLVYHSSKPKPKPDLGKILKGKSSLLPEKEKSDLETKKEWDTYFKEDSPKESVNIRGDISEGTDTVVESSSEGKPGVKVIPKESKSAPEGAASTESAVGQTTYVKTDSDTSESGLLVEEKGKEAKHVPETTDVASTQEAVPPGKEASKSCVEVEDKPSLGVVSDNLGSTITVKEDSSATKEDVSCINCV